MAVIYHMPCRRDLRWSAAVWSRRPWSPGRAPYVVSWARRRENSRAESRIDAEDAGVQSGRSFHGDLDGDGLSGTANWGSVERVTLHNTGYALYGCFDRIPGAHNTGSTRSPRYTT
jgi:hypothetical protein